MRLRSAAGFSSETGVTIEYSVTMGSIPGEQSVFGLLSVTVHDPKGHIEQRAADRGGQLKLNFSGLTGDGSEGNVNTCFTATATVCK